MICVLPERSSARETNCACGSRCLSLNVSLAELDIEIANHVVVFGGKEFDVPREFDGSSNQGVTQQSEFQSLTKNVNKKFSDDIDQIKRRR